jgi:beta-N-acetylhexosaminidase
LRARLPQTLLITDDMQMQGLQKALGTAAASLQALRAGIDMLCIGNNLLDQEAEMAAIAEAVGQAVREEVLDPSAIGQSIARVQSRKALLAQAGS